MSRFSAGPSLSSLMSRYCRLGRERGRHERGGSATMTANSFGSRAALEVAGEQYQIYRLDAAEGSQDLPFSLKVLLENLLRHEDVANITPDHIPSLPHP